MENNDALPDFRQQYLRHCDINSYLECLQAKYPHLVTVKTIGHSFEGRALKAIFISISSSTKAVKRKAKSASVRSILELNRLQSAIRSKLQCHPKPVILIDGGIHAREWCSVSTALHCASQLTDNFVLNKHLLDAFEFVIVPIVNVDGYEYSHSCKKLWRKSRRPLASSDAIGVDCNRNFSVGWSNACGKKSSYTYRGEKPFSEPETIILKNLMHTLKPKFYLSLHSHGKSIMYPFGFTKLLPMNWLRLRDLAMAGHVAIKKETGSKFRIGNIASIIKNSKKSGGGSPDYAYQTAKIPFVIAIEVSGGSFQPTLPEINGIICEGWAGIRAMCVHVMENS